MDSEVRLCSPWAKEADPEPTVSEPLEKSDLKPLILHFSGLFPPNTTYSDKSDV